jgi:hypothetical protein
MRGIASTRIARAGLGLLVVALGTSAQPAPGAAPGAHPPAGARQSPPPASRWPSPEPYAWGPALVDGIELLAVDDAPLVLPYHAPAGGPLQRHMGRPGAWYTAVFLPMRAGWPLQVWLWQRVRTHELRVVALDAAPWTPPSIAVPIAVHAAHGAGRPVLHTAPFALIPSSRADGVFLLIEQWSAAGDRPGPLWVQARSQVVFAAGEPPWWSARPERSASSPLAPEAPPSPLNAPRLQDGIVELPILRRVGASPSVEAGGQR